MGGRPDAGGSTKGCELSTMSGPGCVIRVHTQTPLTSYLHLNPINRLASLGHFKYEQLGSCALVL